MPHGDSLDHFLDQCLKPHGDQLLREQNPYLYWGWAILKPECTVIGLCFYNFIR